MKNTAFKEYATSSAFRIDLSPPMIDALFHVLFGSTPNYRLIMAPFQALERRGLIWWNIIDGRRCGPYPTEAGVIVGKLLQEAGFAPVFDRKPANQAQEAI